MVLTCNCNTAHSGVKIDTRQVNKIQKIIKPIPRDIEPHLYREKSEMDPNLAYHVVTYSNNDNLEVSRIT